MSIGKRVAEARNKAGFNQSDLAEMLDVTFQAVSTWERDVPNGVQSEACKIEAYGFFYPLLFAFLYYFMRNGNEF